MDRRLLRLKEIAAMKKDIALGQLRRVKEREDALWAQRDGLRADLAQARAAGQAIVLAQSLQNYERYAENRAAQLDGALDDIRQERAAAQEQARRDFGKDQVLGQFVGMMRKKA